MRIDGSIEVHYFAYLLIVMYDYIVMHLNVRENYVPIDRFTPITLELLHTDSIAMFVQHFHGF